VVLLFVGQKQHCVFLTNILFSQRFPCYKDDAELDSAGITDAGQLTSQLQRRIQTADTRISKKHFKAYLYQWSTGNWSMTKKSELNILTVPTN
jgi:hypothetical protein